MVSRAKRTPFGEWWYTVDRLMLAALAALMLGGLVLSLAASPPVAARIGLDPFHFVNRHVLFLVPAFVVLIGTSLMPPRWVRRVALMVFIVSMLLLVATLQYAPEVKGSRRWLSIAGTLDRAVELAARDAAASGLPEPVVLLSPACASFDQYPNFEVRGAAFRDAVHALPGLTAAPAA